MPFTHYDNPELTCLDRSKGSDSRLEHNIGKLAEGKERQEAVDGFDDLYREIQEKLISQSHSRRCGASKSGFVAAGDLLWTDDNESGSFSKLASVEHTDTVVNHKAVQRDNRSFLPGMYHEGKLDKRTPVEKLEDFVVSALIMAPDSECWKNFSSSELNKFAGIGAGLNEAKEATKTAAVAGWKGIADGTVLEFLSRPNAINKPLFKTVEHVFEAMAKDPNTVNKAMADLANALIEASNQYSSLSSYEQGKVIGKAMFGLVNPEGSTEAGADLLKIANNVGSHVDQTVLDTSKMAVRSMKNMDSVDAQQGKQLWLACSKGKKLNETQLEPSDISSKHSKELSQHDERNVFLADHKECGLAKSQPGTLAGAGGEWSKLNERPSPDVVKQSDEMSCVSACGEMLSTGTIDQATLVEKLGTPCDTRALAAGLGPPWIGDAVYPNILDTLLKGGPWATQLRELAPKIYRRANVGHTVVVDGLDDAGHIMIRDPANGTRYEMTRECFLAHWALFSVFKN